MNYMYRVLTESNKKDNAVFLRNMIKKEKIKISEKFTKLNKTIYYKNVLPIVSKDRDVLKKPHTVCSFYINWKNKAFKNTNSELLIKNELKQQWGFSVTTVDSEHTRNNFKNKESVWVIFDTEEEALKNMKIFNMLFRTAIEQDAIDEYKKFKQNPMKRMLTYDKLVENAYELYELVDKGLDQIE